MTSTATFRWLPQKDVVEDELMGDYQIEMKEKHVLPSSKVKQILQTFFDNEIRAPQQTAETTKLLGLVIKKIQSASISTRKLSP